MPAIARMATLARWLGPWGPKGAPEGIARETIAIEPRRDGERRFEALLYRPRGRVAGEWLIAPGLHFKGPTDPRLDRFCRILAAAGFVVLSPALPDHLRLTLDARAVDDLDRAFDALVARVPGATPAIFSISFGSFPATRVAGRRGRGVKSLLLFGGFSSFREVARAACTSPDPLLRPVAFKNLVRWMPDAPPPGRCDALDDAWLRFCAETWNRPERKERDAFTAVAREIAATLPEDERRLFLQGCNAADGGVDLVEAATRNPALPRLDPEADGIVCPVHVFHGVDDVTIPVPEAHALAAKIPGATLRFTGLYGHSEAAGGKAAAMLGELRTLLSMLDEIARPGV